MATLKIEFTITIEENNLSSYDWILDSIEQQLNEGEEITEYKREIIIE